jgi:hypothetical protein
MLKKMSATVVVGMVLVLLPGLAWSRTADELEVLLETKELSYAQAARFVLEAADVIVLSDGEEAFRYAQERKWLPARIAADDTARMGNVSLLLLRSYGIRGGLFFTLFLNAHYAYREIKYRQILPGRTDPEMAVSGEWLLYMVSKILAMREAGEV